MIQYAGEVSRVKNVATANNNDQEHIKRINLLFSRGKEAI